MKPTTSERIRWATIISTIGYGAFVIAPIAYKESMWLGMKMGALAALFVIIGNVMMSFFNRRHCDEFNGFKQSINQRRVAR